MRNVKKNRPDLSPGQLFAYRGPKKLAVLPTRAVGQVLGLEPDVRVVHIATFREEPQCFAIDIQFIPLADEFFVRSFVSLLEVMERPRRALFHIQRWRERYAAGDVGVFALPIWKVEELAWETARSDRPGESLSGCYLEYALPLKGADGRWTRIEVSCVRRSGVTERHSGATGLSGVS